MLFYSKIIYALKKVLWSFHKKLQPVIVIQQATSHPDEAGAASDKCTLFIREYKPNKAFYKAFFVKLVANYQHCRAKYRDFCPILINLQRHLKQCLMRHKQLACKAIQEFWLKDTNNATKRDTAWEYYSSCYELMSVDLNYTGKKLQSKREDGSFARNAKNLFNLFILHDPLINKIILKMQEHIIYDTNPENNKDAKMGLDGSTNWNDYGDIQSETMSETGSSSTQAKRERGTNPPKPTGNPTLTNAELMQQVIHEDFKRIVDDMRAFRVDHYD